MASEERDRNFNKALARHLRSAASRDAACPDSGVLAAYHERSLLPEEMNSCKEHIVGCTNCQTILAHLEATDEIPLPAAEEEKVLASTSSVVEMIADPLKASPSAPARAAGPAIKSRRALLLQGARWRWLAPAGAIAAGLLVWIALHENRSIPLPSSSDIKIASNSPAPEPPLAQRPPTLPSPSASVSRSNSQPAPQEITSSKGRVATKAPNKQKEIDLGDESKAVDASAPADKVGGLRKDVERGASEGYGRADKKRELDTRTAPPGVGGAVSSGLAEKAELQAREQIQTGAQAPAQQQVQLQDQPATAQLQGQASANSRGVAGPSSMNQVVEPKNLKRAASVKPAAPPPVPASAMEVVTVSDPRFIRVPGSNFVWLAGPAGSIEFSSDGGRSWLRQTSGVLVDLVTGSALSEKVCWIVGRAGAILLTTDGGEHWKTVTPPISEDLGGIRATDALDATVWNAKNTKTFETSDGGLTWRRVGHR